MSKKERNSMGDYVEGKPDPVLSVGYEEELIRRTRETQMQVYGA